MADDSLLQDDTIQLPRNPLLTLSQPSTSAISPLEQEVLDEYERLLSNMNQVSHPRPHPHLNHQTY